MRKSNGATLIILSVGVSPVLPQLVDALYPFDGSLYYYYSKASFICLLLGGMGMDKPFVEEQYYDGRPLQRGK